VTLAAGGDEGERGKFRATLNDVDRLSLLVWAGTIVLTIVWSILGNKSFLEAFIAASLLAAAGVVGQGVFGIGGGQMSWAVRSPGQPGARTGTESPCKGLSRPWASLLLLPPNYSWWRFS
jgi:hypothetical protein